MKHKNLSFLYAFCREKYYQFSWDYLWVLDHFIVQRLNKKMNIWQPLVMQQSKNIMRIFFFMSKLLFLTRVSYFPIYNSYQRAILSIKILVTQNIWDYFGLTWIIISILFLPKWHLKSFSLFHLCITREIYIVPGSL